MKKKPAGKLEPQTFTSAGIDFTLTHDGRIIAHGRTGTYEIRANTHTCTCPDFVNRQLRQGGQCKHLKALVAFVTQKQHEPNQRDHRTAAYPHC